MSQGAADWYLRKPFILAVLGTSLSAGRLSGNLWWQRLMENARAVPEAVGPVVMQNFGKGSQQSTYGIAQAPFIADFNPTHVLTEGFAINDCVALPTIISRPDHMANMQTIHNILKAKNPAVDITWQTMNGVDAAGASLRPDLQLYYDDEVTKAAAMGDRMLNHYYGLPTPPAPVGGWPKPLPSYLTDSNDGLHPIWDGALEVYFWPGMIYWLRCRMAEWWGLPIPNPPEPPPLPDADFLLVAGGGGGGVYVGAGGGAGGRRRAGAYLSALVGPVLVGFGGEKGSGSGGTSFGFNGLDSVLGLMTALGGGFGAGYSISPGKAGGDGGSGGGSYGPGVSGGAGIAGQGFAGGTGQNPNGIPGGGGGAGGVGGLGVGGVGVLADWPGVPALTYICGGGSAPNAYPNAPNAYPNGGGPTNYGGGGRGGDEAGNAAYTGDPGGDGTVRVWYAGAARAVGGTVTTFGGFTLHSFTRADMAPHVKLTADVSGGYSIFTSTAFSATYAGWKALNGRGAGLPPTDSANDNAWVTSNGAAFPHWLKVQLPAAKAFKGYRIQVRDFVLAPSAVAAQCPKTWTLYGTTDNVNFVVCDARVNEAAWTSRESRIYNMNGPGRGTAFLYYQIQITATQGNDLNRTHLAAFDLLPALDLL